VGLQPLENKALSWGIIGKAALILAEITVRKSQLFAQNAAINDQKAAEDAAAQLQTPFTSSSQGFGTVSSTLNISNNQRPILSGLDGVSLVSATGAQISAIADQNSHYEVLVPLRNTFVISGNVTMNAFDPITNLALASATLNLSKLTANLLFNGSTLSGKCPDDDADNPDEDDPDCD
jgi:hypothetical protein